MQRVVSWIGNQPSQTMTIHCIPGIVREAFPLAFTDGNENVTDRSLQANSETEEINQLDLTFPNHQLPVLMLIHQVRHSQYRADRKHFLQGRRSETQEEVAED